MSSLSDFEYKSLNIKNSDVSPQPKNISNYLQHNEVILALHPLNINPSNAIASILTIRDVTSKSVFLMIQDKTAINIAAAQELPNDIFVPYGDSKTLTSALVTHGTILIDSISLFRLADLGDIFKKRRKECHLIIFGSPNMTSKDLKYMSTYFPEYQVLSYHILNQGPQIKYKLERSFLTSNQVNRYIEINELESNISKHKSVNDQYQIKSRSALLKCCNFVYPEYVDDITWDLDRGQGGWIDKNIFKTLQQFSPKINRLLVTILSNFECKHVVYTRFSNKYGLDLIDTLLTYLDIPHVVVTNKDGSNEQYGKITTFSDNNYNYSVLLTNEILHHDIANVTHLHFLEGVDHMVVKSFIQRTNQSKSFRNSLPLDFVIHFHITSFPLKNKCDNQNDNIIEVGDEYKTTPDEDLYDKISSEMISSYSVFTTLMSKADLIGFDSKIGLCVVR